MSIATASTKTNQAFQMKGSLFTLMSVQLNTVDLTTIQNQLQQMVANTPKLFSNTPVVIDLSVLQKQDVDVNFTLLNTLFRESGLIPMGVKAGSATQHQAAIDFGLGILPDSNKSQAEPKSTPTETNKQSTKLITQNIRSGQQIYAKDSDLIIVGSVSHGAELLADGNIHIYGPLRGRALAGIRGDKNARIFCQSLEAEMISIAGIFLLNDETNRLDTKKSTQIYLKGEQLIISHEHL